MSTQRRRLALLALIAVEGRRGISRDRVLACLWPESSTANARHGLEQLLYGIRRQLGAPLFLGVDPLRLDPEVITSDVTEFDEAFERGDMAAATSLYRGSFLDGFYLSDAEEFERYVETERARLARRYATGLEQLARQARDAGHPAAAIEHWRRLVALDPVSSQATLGLMTALAEADESTEAIRHGRAYEALARVEGAEPSPAVVALLKRLVAREPKHHRPPSPAPALESPHVPPRAARSVSAVRPSRHAIAAVVVGVVILLLVLRNVYSRSRSVTVVATGDASKDVQAVQAAVDRFGEVLLQGQFSFDIAPTKPVDPLLASGWYPAAAEIRISKGVNIFGMRNARGEMATIESGTIPFYVDARGEHVIIRGLRFVRPTSAAILVRAVQDLEISSAKIEGVVPFSAGGSGGIAINTHGGMGLLSAPGMAQNVSGHLLIAANQIDGTGGTAQSPTAGILVMNVGQDSGRQVEVDIIGNQISNTTAPTINIRRIHGTVRVLGNTLRTSAETVGDVDAVRLVNADSMLMANNTVECRWANAAGIQVYSPYAEWPTERVIVADNRVLMSPSPGATLGDFSAGISIRGFARRIAIRHNSIRGRAGAALSMYAFRGGVPADNAFIDNDLEGFVSTVADIVVGSGVERGRIVGPGSVSDHGAATVREHWTASRR